MALEAVFRALVVQLRKLGDDLNVLQLTLGDRPPKSESALVDHFDNAVLDMAGHLHEAIQSACEALTAVGHPIDLDRARRALTACQTSFHGIEQQYSTEIFSYEKLKDLAELGAKRPREWASWTHTMKEGIEHCRYSLAGTSEALVGCWQELAEHLGRMSISVQATNVGQQIASPELIAKGEGEKRWL